jgi:anion-transporting  ArsA/GET3 family ATPase
MVTRALFFTSARIDREVDFASLSSQIIHRLIERRLIGVLGKGGVGRTTIGAAIATVAARRGRHTLLIEADLRGPVAVSRGKRPGFKPVELESNLFAMTLGGQESLEDYLGFVVPRMVLRAVFASSIYQYFVHAAPALRELTMMGKVYHEIERRAAPLTPWDLVVFDAPASGQALSMIRTPFAARETFGESVVGREARNIARLLLDPRKCAMVAVTTAEALAMAETLELNRALATLQIETKAIFFNRTSPAAFEAGDIARLVRRGACTGELKHRDRLADIARAELQRRVRGRRALAILQRQVRCEVIEIGECSGQVGAALTDRLVAEIERGGTAGGVEVGS